jgi:hypothetical protein
VLLALGIALVTLGVTLLASRRVAHRAGWTQAVLEAVMGHRRWLRHPVLLGRLTGLLLLILGGAALAAGALVGSD